MSDGYAAEDTWFVRAKEVDVPIPAGASPIRHPFPAW